MAGFEDTKNFFRQILTHPIFKGILEFVLTVAILFFFIAGGLVVAFRTDSYWMAVISDSMKHENQNWQVYYEDLDARKDLLAKYSISIDPEDVSTYDTSKFPLQGGFERGDLLIIQGVSSVSDISVGDVLIIDRTPYPIPLTHRVLAVWSENGRVRFTTKGDHNQQPFSSTEILIEDKTILPERIIGKVSFVVPKLGSLALWLQGR